MQARLRFFPLPAFGHPCPHAARGCAKASEPVWPDREGLHLCRSETSTAQSPTYVSAFKKRRCSKTPPISSMIFVPVRAFRCCQGPRGQCRCHQLHRCCCKPLSLSLLTSPASGLRASPSLRSLSLSVILPLRVPNSRFSYTGVCEKNVRSVAFGSRFPPPPPTSQHCFGVGPVV